MAPEPVTEHSASLAARAADLKDTHLTCRTIGHAWKPLTASWHADEGAYFTGYRCTRCRCERQQWLDRFGRPVSNTYVYPEGYQMAGLGRLDRDDRGTVRLEALARMLAPAERPSGHLRAV